MLGLIRNDPSLLRISKADQRNPTVLTNAPRRLPISTRDCAKIRKSSAKRKSNKFGPPSIKLKPTLPTWALHSRMVHCNTAQIKRGLCTHPCRTLPVVLNFLLCPVSPKASPDGPKYTHCKIHTRWTRCSSSK